MSTALTHYLNKRRHFYFVTFAHARSVMLALGNVKHHAHLFQMEHIDSQEMSVDTSTDEW